MVSTVAVVMPGPDTKPGWIKKKEEEEDEDEDEDAVEDANINPLSGFPGAKKQN